MLRARRMLLPWVVAVVALAPAGALADKPREVLLAPTPIIAPLDEVTHALQFGYADGMDATTYGVWLGLQQGAGLVSFLFDTGLEPTHATFGDGRQAETCVGGQLTVAMGMKVRFFLVPFGDGGRVGMVWFFKGSGSVQIFHGAGFGYQWGSETGLVLGLDPGVMGGVHMEFQPFFTAVPVLGGQLAFDDDTSLSFDAMRAGGSIIIGWPDNPTPLILSAGATFRPPGDLVSWSAAFGLLF